MRRFHWFLILAIAAPVVAAPKIIKPKDLAKVDAKVETLTVELDDNYVNRLARFRELRDLTLTGPYSACW